VIAASEGVYCRNRSTNNTHSIHIYAFYTKSNFWLQHILNEKSAKETAQLNNLLVYFSANLRHQFCQHHWLKERTRPLWTDWRGTLESPG
jgi:hypothetical protein